MMSFKFQYAVKPSADYKIRYGIKNKPRPYPFNFTVGLKHGNYKFDYDRRDQIHIEKGEVSYVSWGKDMDIEKRINPIVKKLHEIEVSKETELEKLIKNEISSRILDKELKKNKVKNLYIEKSLELENIKLKYLDVYEEFLVTKNKIRDLYKEKDAYQLKRNFRNELLVDEDLNGLDKPTDEIMVDFLGLTLETIKKALEREVETMIYRNNSFELEKEKIVSKLENTPLELCHEQLEKSLDLNLLKQLEKNRTTELTSDFNKNLDIEKIEVALSKEESSEIVVKSIVLLSKLSHEININKEIGPFFKILNEIHKHQEMLNSALFLYTDYEIGKEIEPVEVESTSENMEQFKDKHLDKNFEVDLTIEESFKMLIINTKHDLYEEVKEKLLKNTTINEIEIEECFKQIEEVYEIIISIEKRMKQLDKESIVDLYKEKDIHQLIKKLVIHDLITIEESVELEKSPIGNVLLEYSKSLDKASKDFEIVIDESIPMFKAYKEIMINDDIQATKKSIEIDISKEKEFSKVISEIEIEKNETKIKFNKRFWFLRATDPFDWKVLPYSDYPYRKDPIIFNQDKKIPDNWQLEMIPKLHQEISEHPMPFGEDLGDEEMALSIKIMIDIINIMILIWSRMYYNFSGYTGSQAVIRFTKLLYDWLMLETSIEEMEKKYSKEHYFRAYRWIRWEGEKVAIKARDDMSLSGNMYIDEWIFELIYYMENHHFDTMPIFDVVSKMDEFRALLPTDDPQGDINFILDKVKGMRHKIIECKANKSNE